MIEEWFISKLENGTYIQFIYQENPRQKAFCLLLVQVEELQQQRKDITKSI